jgi:hypothetical protein
MVLVRHGARSLLTNGAPTWRAKVSLSTIKASDQLPDELRIIKRKLTSQFLKSHFRAHSTTVKETC